jgi:hypothetical protein
MTRRFTVAGDIVAADSGEVLRHELVGSYRVELKATGKARRSNSRRPSATSASRFALRIWDDADYVPCVLLTQRARPRAIEQIKAVRDANGQLNATNAID